MGTSGCSTNTVRPVQCSPRLANTFRRAGCNDGSASSFSAWVAIAATASRRSRSRCSNPSLSSRSSSRRPLRWYKAPIRSSHPEAHSCCGGQRRANSTKARRCCPGPPPSRQHEDDDVLSEEQPQLPAIADLTLDAGKHQPAGLVGVPEGLLLAAL